MSRTLSGNMLSAIASGAVKFQYAIDLMYDSGAVYAWGGIGTLNFLGNDYLGVGNFGAIGGVSEDTDLQAADLSLTLSGVNSANISTALNENYQGRIGRLWAIVFDENYAIDGYVKLFEGTIDQQKISIGDETATISVVLQNEFTTWDRPKERRFNNADQQQAWPGDRFFEFTAEAKEKTIFWGRRAPE